MSATQTEMLRVVNNDLYDKVSNLASNSKQHFNLDMHITLNNMHWLAKIDISYYIPWTIKNNLEKINSVV